MAKEAAVKESVQSLDESTTLSRREFTLEAALAVLAGCIITVACDDDNNPNNPTTPANINATFSANHGHELTITSAQITAGNALQLTTTGSTATHTHTVSLSQANLQTLVNRQPVSVESSNDSFHSHTVTFTPM
jgi:hypothetical protein